MNYILLALATFMVTAQNIFTKEYSRKGTNGPLIYSAMATVAALIVFVISGRFQFSFNSGLTVYALCFALAFSASLIGATVAIGCGPLSISNLIINYSLVIPALYGIIFLHEPVKLTMGIGFLLVLVSLALINIRKNEEKHRNWNMKWVISAGIAFIGNGMCSTVQRMQQIAFQGRYKSEFMIFSLAIVAAVLFISAGFRERKTIRLSIKAGWYLSVLYGICNGLTNLFVMILGNLVPLSLMFPVISAGSLVFSTGASIFIYKERLTMPQLLGVSLGICSVILLNF